MPQELTAPKKPARRPRPLKAEQIWQNAIRPMIKLRERLAKIQDPALGEMVKQLQAMETLLWKLRQRRGLGEAQAKDRGEVCWMVFHPRGRGIFELGTKVTRTPNTILKKDEFFTIPDDPPAVAAPSDVWTDLERELHHKPLDLAKFDEHARYVDESYRKFLARGGPEADKEAA